MDHPDQVRLTAALEDARTRLAPGIAVVDGLLALRLDVGLPVTIPLLAEHDLDNYVFPLAKYLVAMTGRSFASVWCTKRHAAESFVRSGDRFNVRTSASASSTAYKQQIHDQLADARTLSEGPVSLQLAFVVGPSRNWLNLWKPTIDALDPLLGRTRPGRAWHPRDGRIVELGLHCAVDPDLVNDILISVFAASWRA
jgi:hypothetical protein